MLATPGIPGMQDQSQEGFWATMHGSPQVSSPPPAHHLRSVLPDFTPLTAALVWEAQDQGAASKTQPSSIRKPHLPDSPGSGGDRQEETLAGAFECCAPLGKPQTVFT